jgi:hypothetical protein
LREEDEEDDEMVYRERDEEWMRSELKVGVKVRNVL